MSFKVVLIDDEPLAIRVLTNYIAQIKELQLVQAFSNAIEASTFLQKNEVDIVFLDINMPVMNGLELLDTMTAGPMVVITTAHEEHALKGYELEAIDYLVKPIPFPRFLKAVNRIIRLKEGTKKMEIPNSPDNTSIFVKVDKKKLQKVFLQDIIVIESLKDYIRIITVTDKYIIHKTLSSFTEELPADKFIRIHRSYTIAIDKINVIEGNSIEVRGTRYTIGRSYLNDVKERILKDDYN